MRILPVPVRTVENNVAPEMSSDAANAVKPEAVVESTHAHSTIVFEHNF